MLIGGIPDYAINLKDLNLFIIPVSIIRKACLYNYVTRKDESYFPFVE